MQPLAVASDLTARIAEVQAVGHGLDLLRYDVIGIGGRVGGIAADTRWRSKAMAEYERSVDELQDHLGRFAAKLTVARDQLRGVADEMVVAELMRSAQPGASVMR